VLELVGALNRILRTNLTPTFAPPRVGDVKFSKADIRRTRADLGYEPAVSFEEGLQATVEWYLEKAEQELPLGDWSRRSFGKWRRPE
jgi:UDP-glucose 4-epimerase